MFTARRSSLAPGLALALLLAGCGQVGNPSAPTGSLPAAPSVSNAGAAALEAPVDPPTAAVVDPLTAGSLSVQVGGLGGYHVQATTDQVVRLRITLAHGPLTTPVVKEVLVADLGATQGLVAFDQLPSGTVDVTIEALDANGHRLGVQTTSSAIVKGQTTVIAATLKLDPTHLVNPNGSAAIAITLQNGDLVIDPIAPASAAVGVALQPVPARSPRTPDLGVNLGGPLAKTWYQNGTLAVAGSVANTSATARMVKVTLTFRRHRLLGGYKAVEARTLDLGLLAAGGVKTFSATSTARVSSWRGNGQVQAELVVR